MTLDTLIIQQAQNSLANLISDSEFLIGGVLSDSASTYIGIKKFGISKERAISKRNKLEKYGPFLGTIKNLLDELYAHTTLIAPMFLIELGIKYAFDMDLNLTHYYCLVMGSLSYLAGAGNLLNAMGMKKAAKIVAFPVHVYNYALSQLFKKSLGKDSYQ